MSPAIIPELIKLLIICLFFLIEYRTATIQPCEGLIPCNKPNKITPKKREISCCIQTLSCAFAGHNNLTPTL